MAIDAPNGSASAAASNSFVEDSLALELIDANLYRSTRPLWHPPGARGIFGGAVIAQALSAALKTVDSKLQVHSLHSYFVLAYRPTSDTSDM
jgi:acyl-CoA thioesterase II